MAKNRKAAEATCLKLLNELCPGNANIAIWAEKFKAMSDKEFDDFMNSIRDGFILNYFEPVLTKGPRVTVESNLDFLDKHGDTVRKKIWFVNEDGSRTLSKFAHLVAKVPVRRQAQLGAKKISIPESDRVVDDISGQPTGPSKGSKVSYPQQGILDMAGLTKSMEEFNFYRSGDLGGYSAAKDAIIRNGTASMAGIKQARTGVESVKALSALLKAAHIGNNLMEERSE